MSTPGKFRDQFAGRGRRGVLLAQALRESARWRNGLDALPPLYVEDAGEAALLRLRAADGLLFDHPWRILVDRSGSTPRYQVTGGRVHDGLAWHTVDGLETTTLPATLCVWLRATQYNDAGTPDTYVLQTGASFPASAYSADTLPGGDLSQAILSGWARTIVPLGTAGSASATVQYRYSDLLLERGLTIVAPRLLGFGCVDGDAVAWMLPELLVRGIVRRAGDPYSVALAQCGSQSSASSASSSSGSSGPEWAGAGWYWCIGWYTPEEWGMTCDDLYARFAGPVLISTQEYWDSIQFDVCWLDEGSTPPLYRMNTTDGVRYATREECEAAHA